MKTWKNLTHYFAINFPLSSSMLLLNYEIKGRYVRIFFYEGQHFEITFNKIYLYSVQYYSGSID